MFFSTASIRKAFVLTASAAALLLSSDHHSHHSVAAAPIAAAWMTPQERRFVASVSPDTFLGYRLSQASNVTLFMEDLHQERALNPTPSGSGGGGCASGNAQKQLVYLQFDPISPTYPIDLYSMMDGAFCRTEQVPRRRYTEEQKEAIQARLEADYAFLNDSFVFTTEPPHPLQGAYSTVRFYHEFSLFDVYDRTRFELGVENCSVALEDASTLERLRVGILGGNAENIDFLNTNKADMAVFDILDHVHTELMLDPTGVGLSNYLQIPMTTTSTVEDFVHRLIINGGANFAAHELGHLAGLRHHDAFGPIGSTRVTNLEEYYNHVLTTPALGGIVALTSLYTRDTFFSERSATKLYLSLHATPMSEDQVQDYPTIHGRPMELEIVHVPNTLRSGVNSHNNTAALDTPTTPTFPIGVGIVYGSLSSVVDTDRFLFTLEAGTFLSVEVISISDTKFIRWIDPYVKLYYYPHSTDTNNKTELVYEDVDLESPDVWFNNFPIQVTGTYEIEVGDNNYVFGGGIGGGDYALYIHTGGFPLVAEPPVLESWDYICDAQTGGKIHCFSHGDAEDWHYHNKCFSSEEEIDAYASKDDHQYIGRGCCEEQQGSHFFDPSLELKADKETEEYCRTFLPDAEEEEVTLRNRRRSLRQRK